MHEHWHAAFPHKQIPASIRTLWTKSVLQQVSFTLYFMRVGCLPPVIGLSSSLLRTQRTGLLNLRNTFVPWFEFNSIRSLMTFVNLSFAKIPQRFVFASLTSLHSLLRSRCRNDDELEALNLLPAERASEPLGAGDELVLRNAQRLHRVALKRAERESEQHHNLPHKAPRETNSRAADLCGRRVLHTSKHLQLSSVLRHHQTPVETTRMMCDSFVNVLPTMGSQSL